MTSRLGSGITKSFFYGVKCPTIFHPSTSDNKCTVHVRLNGVHNPIEYQAPVDGQYILYETFYLCPKLPPIACFMPKLLM